MQRISVIIPAHNEQRYLGACLDSVAAAAARVALPVETVVVLNRCTDGTEAVARAQGAIVAREDARNLARIRNAGARCATGDVLVTLDADSRMSANMLAEIRRKLDSGNYVGGGVRMKAERMSLGIFCSCLTFMPWLFWQGFAGGLFWMWRRDFEAIGGFNEQWVSAEDVDLSRRLKAHGAARGLRFGVIRRAYIVTSCRKFDHFGDWFLFRNRPLVARILGGRDQAAADRLYYDCEAGR